MVPLPVMEKGGPWYTANDDYRFYWALWAGGVALAVIGAALLWARARLRWIGPMLLAVLLLVDLWSLLFSYVAYAPADQYYPETRFLRDLKSVPPTERIITRFAGLIANSALVYGIRDWRAQDPMLSDRAYKAALLFDPDLPKRPGDNYNMVLKNMHLQVAPMLGIRYLVSTPNPNNEEPEPDRPPITRLEYKEGLGLWRIEGVPGFTYLSDNVQVVPGEAAAHAWMQGLTWAQVRSYSAIVEAPPDALAAVHHDPAGTSPGNVQVEEYNSGHIKLKTNALRPALLVVAESWYPGWRATLDGQPVQVLRANYLSQGAVVPTGSHLVELEYSPDSFRYGQMISLGALLVLAFLVVWVRRDTNVSADARLHQVPVGAIQPRSNLVLWDKWDRLYLALYILYIVAGMWARGAGWISGDALIFVNAARHVLDGSFDLYSLVVNTASAPPLGTGYSYSPLMALIIAPFVGLADLLGWGQAGAERLMALPLMVIDVVAMHQLRRLVRAWRPAVDEGLLFLGVMITLLLTGFWVATAYAGHDEGLVLLCLLLTLRYLPHNLLLSGLWAGLALAAKQTALLQIMPIGVALMLGALGMRFAGGRDVPSGSQAATKRPLDAFKWSAVALAVFAFFMLPAVLANPDAVWYAFVTAMSRLAIYGTGLPVWVDNLSQRMLSADGYAWAHEVLVNYSNLALIVLVGLASVAAVWKWAKTDPHRQGRIVGLMDARLLALVAFGGVSQVALGKWVGGHYYALPLALVFIWDIVRTAPVGPHTPRTAELTIHSFPVIGLGAPILFRSLTAFGPGALTDGLLLILFLGLMLVTFNGAKADPFSELKSSQDS
jgi:hypothetical protein